MITESAEKKTEQILKIVKKEPANKRGEEEEIKECLAGLLSGRVLAQKLTGLRFKSLPRHPVVEVSSSLTSSSCCSYYHHATEACRIESEMDNKQTE